MSADSSSSATLGDRPDLWELLSYLQRYRDSNPAVQSDNLLHNPDGRISQRPSPSTTADDNYGGPDRWYSLSQTGSITATQGTLGGANAAPFTHKIIQAQAAPQRMGRAQIVEFIDCGVLQRNPCTLSGILYSTQEVMIAILGWAGATNVVTGDVVLDWNSTDYTPGGFFISTVTVIAIISQPISLIEAVPFMLTGDVDLTVGNIVVLFWTKDLAAQNTELYFLAKLEKGTEATRFYAPDPTIELVRCQRYYQLRGEDKLTALGVAGPVGFSFTSHLPVQMRASPTVVAGVYTNNNITGTPTSVADTLRLIYSGTVTANNVQTIMGCTGTTLSADL